MIKFINEWTKWTLNYGIAYNLKIIGSLLNQEFYLQTTRNIYSHLSIDRIFGRELSPIYYKFQRLFKINKINCDLVRFQHCFQNNVYAWRKKLPPPFVNDRRYPIVLRKREKHRSCDPVRWLSYTLIFRAACQIFPQVQKSL